MYNMLNILFIFAKMIKKIYIKFKIDSQEDTYEAGIANDMRELELRWEFELQEQEKHWSSEEDNSKK